jgi:hypothetical protein
LFILRDAGYPLLLRVRLSLSQAVQPLSFMTWRLTFRCNMSQENLV